MAVTRKTIETTVAKMASPRTFRFTLSTADPDRDGDSIDPRGWKLDEYKRDPRILWAHQHTVPAIARSSYIGVVGNKLVADAEFPPRGIYPFADSIHDLVAEGYITTASVGFRPEDASQSRTRSGMDYHSQTLLEWSIVNVPVLPQARLENAIASAGQYDMVAIQKWLGGTRHEESDYVTLDLGATDTSRHPACPMHSSCEYSASAGQCDLMSECPLARKLTGRKDAAEDLVTLDLGPVEPEFAVTDVLAALRHEVRREVAAAIEMLTGRLSDY
jgi:hypothetical protein